MAQRMTVGAGLSLCILLLTLHDASGQTAERRSQDPPAPADAVAEARPRASYQAPAPSNARPPMIAPRALARRTPGYRYRHPR